MRWVFRGRGWRGAHPTPHTSHASHASHTSHSSARPRVARAVQAAQMAQAGVTRGMGSAMAGLEALFAPTIPAGRMNGISGMSSVSSMNVTSTVSGADASLGSAVALQLPAALMRETTRAARLTGRRPEDVLTEALTDWLAGYSGAAAMAPSPLHAPGRQHSWSEIEETLRALRAS